MSLKTLLNMQLYLNIFTDYSDYIVWVATFVIAYLLGKLRKEKSLSYEVISNHELFSVDSKVKESLEVLYKGKRVENLRHVVLRITNTGKQPISKSDYEVPLSLEFGDGTNLISLNIVDQVPENLKVDTNMGAYGLQIEPLLLNPKDSFSINLIVTGDNFDFNISGRIIGIKEIMEAKESIIIGPAIIIIYLFLMAYVFYIGLTDRYSGNFEPTILDIIVLILGTILVLLFVIGLGMRFLLFLMESYKWLKGLFQGSTRSNNP